MREPTKPTIPPPLGQLVRAHTDTFRAFLAREAELGRDTQASRQAQALTRLPGCFSKTVMMRKH
jgi:hypothetical protein